MSLNSEVIVVPAPGEVVIDGNTGDWDLSAGVWSYNSPDLVEDYSVWTHLMWDAKGVYFLARVIDAHPMQNATEGIDFHRGWQGDSYQIRTVFDDQTEQEHQMHLTLYYSTLEKKPYMIVHHGGLKQKEPYDATGRPRPDQKKRWGETMEMAGGRIAMAKSRDGKGYNIEAFWPWSYLRENGQPLQPGEEFVFGWETLWGEPTEEGATPTRGTRHRLADGVKDAKANRIFMFRARNDWGRALISAEGGLDIVSKQEALQKKRLGQFEDTTTVGSIPIRYQLSPKNSDQEVTIAINDAAGNRVRNLFGQYPRAGGEVTDHWDGLDDEGQPVKPGAYTAVVVDHQPIRLKLLTSLYNAGTPPWKTANGTLKWGSDHHAASCVATHGQNVYVGFSIPEAGVGLNRYNLKKGIQWGSRNSLNDLVVTDEEIFGFEYAVWQKQFKVIRLDPANGKLSPFIDEQGKPRPALILELEADLRKEATNKDKVAFANSVSIAVSGESIWLCLPAQALIQVNAKTGALIKRRGQDDLVSIRSQAAKMYGINTRKELYELDEKMAQTKKLFRLEAMSSPGRFGVSPDGQSFAVCDTKTNQVYVYQLGSKKPVVIGKNTPGYDRSGGPFDAEDVMKPVSAAFDVEGRIWVAEATPNIHRVSVWTPEGKLADEFWGSSPYGATHGWNFAHTMERFIGMGMEFAVDHETDYSQGKSKERALMYHPMLNDSQGTVYRYRDAKGQEHEFAVSAPGLNKDNGVVVYRRDQAGQFVPAAAITNPKAARGRQPSEVMKQLPSEEKPYGWVDHNGNAKVEENELIRDIDYKPLYWSTGWVRPDLSIFTPQQNLYQLKSINQHGVPVYDFGQPQPIPNAIPMVRGSSSVGSPIMDTKGNVTDGIHYHTRDGRQGAYPNPYGRHDAPASQRGLLIAPFRTNGVVEDVPGVGSTTMLQGDRGEWYLMSFDGIFISSLFQDMKGKITLDETLIGAESFGGHYWRAEGEGELAGKVLLQTGKASYRLFEVENLETITRQEISLQVTPEQIAEGVALAAANRPDIIEEGALVLSTVSTLPTSAPDPQIGKEKALVSGEPFTLVSEANNPSRWFKVSLLRDQHELALVYQVADDSPWKNGSDNFAHAFIGGDAVDFLLDSPKKGAVRLLTAPLNGQPQAIYWQKNAVKKENPQTYVVPNNPANARKFDVVKVLEEATVEAKQGQGRYSVLVKLPLEELGLEGKLPEKIRALAGVIFSDQAGRNRNTRLYWFDKNTSMVSDVPTESGIEVERMGEVQIE